MIVNAIYRKSDIRGISYSSAALDTQTEVKSLKGMPHKIKGIFDCSHNMLQTLDEGPQIVKDDYICHHNKLISLKGCAKSIGNLLDCEGNQLTSLEGCPERINGTLRCTFNNLTSLKGAPQTIQESLQAWRNKITSLEGLPLSVQDIDVRYNPIISFDIGATKFAEITLTDTKHQLAPQEFYNDGTLILSYKNFQSIMLKNSLSERLKDSPVSKKIKI